MCNKAIIQIKTESDTKERCTKLFEALGINISNAVNMFLKQSLLRGGLPFEVVMPQPNKYTLEAADEVREQIKTSEKGTKDTGSFFTERCTNRQKRIYIL